MTNSPPPGKYHAGTTYAAAVTACFSGSGLGGRNDMINFAHHPCAEKLEKFRPVKWTFAARRYCLPADSVNTGPFGKGNQTQAETTAAVAGVWGCAQLAGAGLRS